MLRSVSTFLAIALFLCASAARADDLEVDGHCAIRIDVRRWTPDRGPPARFVADALVGAGAMFIALGYSGETFWSVEAAPPNDACERCRVVSLVATGPDGSRRLHRLIPRAAADRGESLPDEVLHGRVLASLWRLARREWPAGALRHDYELALPVRRDAPVLASVEVREGERPPRRFELVGRPFMCWCDYGWRSRRATGAPRERSARSAASGASD